MQKHNLKLLLIFSLPLGLAAQVKKAPVVRKPVASPQQVKADTVLKNYREFPYWIAMMDDPKVNYAQAKLAFELFWEGREIPEETEGEAVNLYPKVATHPESDTVHQEIPQGPHFIHPETYRYIYAYKRMKWWLRENADWVNPKTGMVYTQDEKRRIMAERSMK